MLVAALALSLAADAAELGRLTVRSGVGEPLRAEIEVVGADAGEPARLVARMATADEFWRAGIEPAPAVRGIRVAVTRGAKGRPVVQLSSAAPIDEPFMSLLVHLAVGGRESLREYPVLLEERGGAPEPSLPETTTALALAPAKPAPAPRARPAAEPDARLASGALTHAVQPGETLAAIAQRYLPPGTALDQMSVALFRANEGAFVDGDMNRLLAGRTLVLPDAAAVAAVARDDAQRQLAAHRAGAAREPRPPRDELRVSAGVSKTRASRGSGADVAGREDDVASLEHALKEAHARIELLQENVEGLQRIVELQGRQLGRLQQAATAAAARPGDAIAGDIVAPAALPEPDLRRAGGRLVGAHWQWIAAALIVAFTIWVWMPLKTARLWRKKRRRKERELRRALRAGPERRPRGNGEARRKDRANRAGRRERAAAAAR